MVAAGHSGECNMATAASAHPVGVTRDGRFFVIMALLMALVLVAGFSLQFLAGRSSFDAPILTHAHGVIFFGWVLLLVTQTLLASRGSIGLHRTLGWIGAGWVTAMVTAGVAVVTVKTQAGLTPFFFQPQHFLIVNPMTLFAFAGFTAAAIVNRRRTDWHSRLHLAAMTMILGPGFGRLLPMPLMIPWGFQIAALVGLVFPIAGMIRDQRVEGRVHPAWWWGVAGLVGTLLLGELIVYSPIGDAIYAAVTAGHPGASAAPLDFAPPPAPRP